MNFQCEYCATGHHLRGLACVAEGHAGPPEQEPLLIRGNICRCGASRGELTCGALPGRRPALCTALLRPSRHSPAALLAARSLIDSLRDEVEQSEQFIDVMLCHWAVSVAKATTLSSAPGLRGGAASIDAAVEPIIPGRRRTTTIVLANRTSEESWLG